jgi:hypothetical protein
MNLGNRGLGAEHHRKRARRRRRLDPCPRAQLRGDILNVFDRGNGRSVCPRQRRRRAQPRRDIHALAAANEIAGSHLDDARAGRAQRPLHRRFRAVAERHHRDHRRDADDDAKRREPRAQPIAAQRTPGDLGRSDEEADHLRFRL